MSIFIWVLICETYYTLSKYGLTNEEIAFIESMIKPME